MRLYFAGKEKICTFAVEFIPHSREGNRKTQALKLCVFCFFIEDWVTVCDGTKPYIFGLS